MANTATNTRPASRTAAMTHCTCRDEAAEGGGDSGGTARGGGVTWASGAGGRASGVMPSFMALLVGVSPVHPAGSGVLRHGPLSYTHDDGVKVALLQANNEPQSHRGHRERHTEEDEKAE